MEIQSNGSKWAGEQPDSVEDLIAVLGKEVLDPRFEMYGGHFKRNSDGTYTAFGNFLTLSHVFNITGTREEMAPLGRAIRNAKRRNAYRAAMWDLFGQERAS